MLALTLVVLLAHWLALGGRVNLWPGQGKGHSTMDTLTDPSAVASTPPGTESPAAQAAPEPVNTSTVRWIALPPPPPPPPPKPTPVVRKPPPPSLSSAIEALGEPIAPLPVEDMIEDILESTDPQTPLEAQAPDDTTATPPQATTETEPPPGRAVATAPPGPPQATGPAVPEGSLPANASLSYDVKGQAKGFNYSASGTLGWTQSGNTYVADLEISALFLGSFQRTSTGQITPQGLVPQRYTDRRRSKEKSATFDYNAGVVHYSVKTPDAPLQPGMQDQLSVMLQLAGLLNARDQRVVGDVISVPVSSETGAEVWRFEIGPLESLHLPAGEFNARRLIRQARKPNDKTVEVWLAPNLGRLPVRMRLAEPNGDVMDISLDDMPETAAPAPPAGNNGNSVP
ncbi:MAG: DUF3108 domain-containing protein [Burkholderiaceae bacterium]